MILDFIIGVTLLGTLFHLSFAIWKIRVLSPFGSSVGANICYGIFVLAVSVSLYLYSHGLNQLLQDNLYLGGLFAIAFMIIFGVLVNRKK